MTLDELKAFARSDQFAREIKDVFFDAMINGYASSGTKSEIVSIPKLPGSKRTKFVRNRWTVIDTWHTTPLSQFSGGTTHIWYESVLVWMMQYFGPYSSEAIPCLKAALEAAYSAREFWNGRGPDGYTLDGLVYRNDASCAHENMMYELRGMETISRCQGSNIVGWHHYQGGNVI